MINPHIKEFPSQTEMSGFYVIYHGSAGGEVDGQRGLTHLIEHLGCTTVKKLESDMDDNAISWNAMTADDSMVFYMTGIAERVSKMVQPFLNKVLHPTFTEKEFERERKVVLQEYQDSFNAQTGCHYYNLMRAKYGYCTPIGYREDLEKTTYKDCLNLVQQVRRPSEIIAVGLPSLKGLDKIRFADPFTFPPLSINHNKKLKFESFKSNDNASLIMLSNPLPRTELPTASFLARVLGQGFRSPLYKELRDARGLVYYVSTYPTEVRKSGLFGLNTETSKKKAKEAAKVIQDVLHNPKKYITSSRVESVRQHLRAKKKINDLFLYERLGSLMNPETSVYSAVDTVTVADLRQLCEKVIQPISIDSDGYKHVNG